MATITCFEEMLSWQKARILNNIIYSKTKEVIFNKDFALRDQIRKSSISIMSNIAEGFERGSDSEFKYFLNVAKGSAGEVRSQLYIAFDQGYIDNELFNRCKDLVLDISRLLQGFMEYLQKEIDKSNQRKT
jgi:four helix bundle protein